MRLSDQRLAVRTDEAEVFDGVGDVPAVIAIFPFTATAEAAHRRRGAAFILGGERHLVSPTAPFRTIGVHLAVDFVADEVFPDQAGNHATPAPVRIDVADLAVEQDVGLAGHTE